MKDQETEDMCIEEADDECAVTYAAKEYAVLSGGICHQQ